MNLLQLSKSKYKREFTPYLIDKITRSIRDIKLPLHIKEEVNKVFNIDISSDKLVETIAKGVELKEDLLNYKILITPSTLYNNVVKTEDIYNFIENGNLSYKGHDIFSGILKDINDNIDSIYEEYLEEIDRVY